MKIVYYKVVKSMINDSKQAKVIINIVVKHYSLPESIINNRSSLFTSKFWSLLYSFLDIKQKLFAAFYSQTNG